MYLAQKFNWLLAVIIFSFVFYAFAETDLEQLFNDKNYDEFFPQAESKARQDDKTAFFLLGKANHLGLGTKINIHRAIYFYIGASKLGDARADNNLGLIYEKSGDVHEAQKYYQQAIDRGLTMPTLHNLVRLCQKDIKDSIKPRVEDVKKCEQYHEMLYQKDNTEQSLYLVSQMKTIAYLKIGTQENKEEALRWLNKAIAQGSVESITNKGLVYEFSGEGKLAKALFEQAAQKEQPLALYKMGVYSEDDSFESINWFGKAASYGSIEAYFRVENIAGRFNSDDPIEVNFSYEQWEKVLLFIHNFSKHIKEGKADRITGEKLSYYYQERAADAYRQLNIKLDASKKLEKYYIDRRINTPKLPLDYTVKMTMRLKSNGFYYDSNTKWKISISQSFYSEFYKTPLLEGVSSEDGTVIITLPKPDNERIIQHINRGDYLYLKYKNIAQILTYEVKDNTIYLIPDTQLLKLFKKSKGNDY